jgi:hypothetical protein
MCKQMNDGHRTYVDAGDAQTRRRLGVASNVDVGDVDTTSTWGCIDASLVLTDHS